MDAEDCNSSTTGVLLIIFSPQDADDLFDEGVIEA